VDGTLRSGRRKCTSSGTGIVLWFYSLSSLTCLCNTFIYRQTQKQTRNSWTRKKVCYSHMLWNWV